MALARTDALNLRGFSAFEEKQGGDGGMDGGVEGKGMGGVEGLEEGWWWWRFGGGLKPACISCGLGRQMGALRGGLRSRPPWMAGKLTPI